MELESDVERIYRALDLSEAIINQKGKSEFTEEELERHLRACEKKIGPMSSSFVFPDDGEWLNVAEPLAWEHHLKGKVVVLDFFTYCCINCMHILPLLSKLEETHSKEDGLVTIGVHSAKFENEKIRENVESAVQRYDIRHPVINDARCWMWSYLGIMCWPSLAIFSPEKVPLFLLMGEPQCEKLFDIIPHVLSYYSKLKKLSPSTHPILLESASPGWLLTHTDLRFPGKICWAQNPHDGSPLLCIADSGHHRIIIATVDGKVKHIVGNGKKGLLDGSFKSAMFNSPQGLAYVPFSSLYVADTENHCIRLIDLHSEEVKQVAGTGERGTDLRGGLKETKQALSSPWDICAVPQLHLLFIAMAGSHQIWTLNLVDGKCQSFAGSGNEENRNTMYPTKASFAQPSGICYSQLYRSLFIADSESSSIRCISLDNASVKGVVGGSRDPKDLFSYGDIDNAEGSQGVKLQHPLGVTCHGSKVYVADTYNHKIKVIDMENRSCETLLGNGSRGDAIGEFASTMLNEPGGLCISPQGHQLFITDTNNHSIKVAHLGADSLQRLELTFPVSDTSRGDTTDRISDQVTSQETVWVSPHGKVVIIPKLQLPDGIHLNQDTPSKWILSWQNKTHSDEEGIFMDGDEIQIAIPSEEGSFPMKLLFEIFLCSDIDSACLLKRINYGLEAHVKEGETQIASLHLPIVVFDQ